MLRRMASARVALGLTLTWGVLGEVVASGQVPANPQSVLDRAVADFRKATELSPKSVFDFLAQASAKKRIEQLGKRLPCGPGSSSSDTCL